jgi:hypothetical protein
MDVPNQAKELSGSSNLVVLRNGETVTGEFYDVSGTQPLRLTFKTASGERVFEARDVRAIYMTKAEGSVAGGAGGSESGAPSAHTVTVSARSWTATGITVRQGQTVNFKASGEITFSPRSHKASPAGSVDNLFDTNAPVPTALQGALVGRLGAGATGRGGSGRVFLIGNQGSVVMPAGGQLFLGVNDSGLNDNQGSFTVGITPAN